MKRFLDFLQYHNSVVLLAFIVFGGAGTIFAATEVAKQIGTETQIDSEILLRTDLDAFDMSIEITSAEETDVSYILTYRFSTLSIVGGAWQRVEKEGSLTIDKSRLMDHDLQTYAHKQLSEIVEQERAYLKKAQSHERAYAEGSNAVPGLAGLSLKDLGGRVKPWRKFVPDSTPEIERPELETAVVEVIPGEDEKDKQEPDTHEDDEIKEPEEPTEPEEPIEPTIPEEEPAPGEDPEEDDGPEEVPTEPEPPTDEKPIEEPETEEVVVSE